MHRIEPKWRLSRGQAADNLLGGAAREQAGARAAAGLAGHLFGRFSTLFNAYYMKKSLQWVIGI
jgi:hypothetical protein